MRVFSISIYLYLGRFISQVKSERNIQGGGSGVPWVHRALSNLSGGGWGSGGLQSRQSPPEISVRQKKARRPKGCRPSTAFSYARHPHIEEGAYRFASKDTARLHVTRRLARVKTTQ